MWLWLSVICFGTYFLCPVKFYDEGVRMMSKKSIFMITIVCLLVSLLTISAFSADVVEPGTGHSITYVPAVDCGCHEDGCLAYWYCETCDIRYATSACTTVVTREELIIINANELAYQPATEPCHDAGNVAYWYCPDCGAVFADEEGTQQTDLESLLIAPAYQLSHVPAAEPCHAVGSAEYWYCPQCDAVFADEAGTRSTTRKDLELAPDCELEYVDAKDACHVDGNFGYWHCPECDGCFTDEAATQLTNRKNMTIPADCPLTHVEAVRPTCHSEGNIEYWYCQECGAYFTDAEGSVGIEAADVVLAIVDHKYVDNVCDMCGQILLETPVIEYCYSKSQTSVRIKWNTVEGAEGYQLLRTTTPEDESSWVSVKTLEATTYTNQNLTEGVTYYYRVRAYAHHANSGKVWSSASNTGYMPAAVVFDAPYSNSDFRIRLRWNEVSGANGYQIWRMDENGEYRVIKTIGDRGSELTNDQGHVTAYSNVNLTAGASYTYKMRAFYITEDGQKVYGTYSDEVTVAVQPSQPSLTLSTPRSGRVMVSWNDFENADGFQVWMAESAGGEFEIVKTVEDGTATSYTKHSLESGKTYYFKVRAFVEVDGKKTFGAYSLTMSIRVG